MYSVTEEVIVWLSGLGYAASTYPKKNPPTEFVTVERTGGTVDDMVDHPSIAIQTWARSEARAEEMAVAIRNEAVAHSLPRGFSKMDVNAGPYPFWDESTGMPRYQVLYDCTAQLTD